MKHIRIKFQVLSLLAITFMVGSCNKDFVTVQPEGQFLSENYFSSPDRAYGALIATYDLLRKNAGGFENMITMMNAGSDDFYAGGGGASDGAGIHGFSNYTLNSNIIPASYWSDHYQGVFRANTLVTRIVDLEMDAALKARFVAEAKTLRAIYYFNLVRMFGNIPLILEPVTTATIYEVTQSPREAVYAQMEKDLSEAIPDLPATIAPDALATEAGRLTKGAAQAMLGKVLLYDNKGPEAAAQFAEVNGTPGQASQYGYKLLTKFSDLWVFTNKFNSEAIIEGLHTNQSFADWGFWGTGADEGNSVNQMVGPRTYSKTAGSDAPDIPSG